MIDHLSVGVDNLARAKKFYDKSLNALGLSCLAEMDGLIAYGAEHIQFLAMMPFNGETFTSANGMHIAFHASSSQAVDAFYNAALSEGATCEGAPGTRAYPHKEVYAAYVRDPFGHKLEALTNGFST
ncbi:VOC family protein [Kordiimonas aquimaris]|uniref:VOC family protein n=1 Tax=Kordiimonas aquimaris TaxID=707591 RepID=UPI0021D0D909|nr:VOC family protein [Kordiimonas aquimaris]